jgi:geranylgeranyl diphosphate synthase type I
LSIVANCDGEFGNLQKIPITDLLELVEKKLHSLALEGISTSSLLGQAIEHQLNLGGSRTRAKLSLQVNQLLTIPKDDSIALAALCELLHQAALVHDDIQDNEVTRRDQPSVWSKFGKDCALCTGDLFISAAYAAIGECNGSGKHRQLIATTHLYIKKIICGQMKDIESRHIRLSLSDYELLVHAKSGALLLLPLEIAFTYLNLTAEQSQLRHFFQDYALAYQALDDLIDYHQDWLTTNALKSPNIVAVMIEKYENVDVTRQAVHAYIEKVLQRMQQISMHTSSEWHALLTAHTQKLQKRNDQLRKKRFQNNSFVTTLSL